MRHRARTPRSTALGWMERVQGVLRACYLGRWIATPGRQRHAPPQTSASAPQKSGFFRAAAPPETSTSTETSTPRRPATESTPSVAVRFVSRRRALSPHARIGGACSTSMATSGNTWPAEMTRRSGAVPTTVATLQLFTGANTCREPGRLRHEDFGVVSAPLPRSTQPHLAPAGRSRRVKKTTERNAIRCWRTHWAQDRCRGARRRDRSGWRNRYGARQHGCGRGPRRCVRVP